MKFKMKGQQVSRNRFVNLRKNMRNEASYSLFTDKDAYKLGWLLNFKDKWVASRFARDMLEQAFVSNHQLLLLKWSLVYFWHAVNEHNFLDVSLIIWLAIIPVLIDAVCMTLKRSQILSTLYYIIILATFNLQTSTLDGCKGLLVLLMIDIMTGTSLIVHTWLAIVSLTVGYFSQHNYWQLIGSQILSPQQEVNSKNPETGTDYYVLAIIYVITCLTYSLYDLYCK